MGRGQKQCEPFLCSYGGDAPVRSPLFLLLPKRKAQEARKIFVVNILALCRSTVQDPQLDDSCLSLVSVSLASLPGKDMWMCYISGKLSAKMSGKSDSLGNAAINFWVMVRK